MSGVIQEKRNRNKLNSFKEVILTRTPMKVLEWLKAISQGEKNENI